MIEVVAVEIVDPHRRRTRADEAVDDVIIEHAHGAHIAVRHDITPDVAAAVSQPFGKSAGAGPRQKQKARMLENERA